MNVPFAATKFDGTMSGFLEDFSHGNANPRRAEFRNICYRKGSRAPVTTFKPSTRQATEKGTSGTMEGGTVGYFETCSGTSSSGNMRPGAVEMSYTLTTPANPTFDALVVNVTASIPSASETGPVAGQFTVTRTEASTNSPLTVNLAMNGTATDGSDYALIGTSVTIPAGGNFATVAVTPVTDAIAERPETAAMNLANGTGYYHPAATSPWSPSWTCRWTTGASPDSDRAFPCRAGS